MITTISVFVTNCLKKLKQLAQSEELDQFKFDVPPALWADELGRLRVWAANIGAHQTGQSSLDFRLRDSSTIRQTLMRVLERLHRTIEDLQDALDGSKVTEEDSISDFSDSEEESEQTEIQSTYHDLRDTISNLFQVSMVIRRPAQYDRLVGTKRSEAVMFEPFDRDHVFNKFPSADEAILNRLGLAISERRAIFRYRERHYMKLAQGIDRVVNDLPDTMSTLMSETVATELLESPERETSGYGSQSMESQTSYTQSIVEGNHGIGMPAPPEGSDNGAPFECPYCFLVISTSSSFDWYRHVFNDLMPYVCIAPTCLTPHRLYQSRREWFEHLQRQHSMTPENMAEVDCPLCQSPNQPGRSLEKHLGRHLEELALFALPHSDQYKNGEDFDSSSSSLSPSEIPNRDAIASEDGDVERLTEALRSLSKHFPNATVFEEANRRFVGLAEGLREPFQSVSEHNNSPLGSDASAYGDAVPSTEAIAEESQSAAELMQQFELSQIDLSIPAGLLGLGDLSPHSRNPSSKGVPAAGWMTFEFTRDGVKMEYKIRTDIETINTDTLSQTFKDSNRVYLLTSLNSDNQQGLSDIFENACNKVGWALAKLNPILQGKRGLLHHAVKLSWRRKPELRLNIWEELRSSSNDRQRENDPPNPFYPPWSARSFFSRAPSPIQAESKSPPPPHPLANDASEEAAAQEDFKKRGNMEPLAAEEAEMTTREKQFAHDQAFSQTAVSEIAAVRLDDSGTRDWAELIEQAPKLEGLSHIDGIEVMTVLFYGDGEQSQSLSAAGSEGVD
ncbi:hypothetical protein N7513_006554 [Penicillium frequentans]|nr:hypothetical protein N7513_006554 [Penicillium glabrum]